MTSATATIHLYDILVEQGVEKDRAQRAVDAFITRAEAERELATTADIHRLELKIAKSETNVIRWVIGAQVAMAALLIGARLAG